ncbi:MAG: DUF2955 domain-containing protein [Kiloniellaceae bacterium]
MSTDAAAPAARAGDGAEARDCRAILRLAFGVAGSFVLAEGLGWNFTFLAPMLCAQLLVRSSAPPSRREAVGALLVVALALGVTQLVTAATISSAPVLILTFLLILFLSFFGQARGVPDFAALMLQLAAVTIPVLALLSPALAGEFATELFKAMAATLAASWIVHACFPDPAPPAGPAPAPPAGREELQAAAGFALRNTLILAPMLAWYLLDATQIALVLLITILMVIRQYRTGTDRKTAAGLLLGNVIGGVAATFVYNIVLLELGFVWFALIVLASCLIFSYRILSGGRFAPVLTIALGTFILLLGIGLSPLPIGSEEAFVSRLINVIVATAYAVGCLLIFGRRQSR